MVYLYIDNKKDSDSNNSYFHDEPKPSDSELKHEKRKWLRSKMYKKKEKENC